MASPADWPPQQYNVTLVVGCDCCGAASLTEALGRLDGFVLPRAPADSTGKPPALEPGDDGGPGYFSVEDRYTRGMHWYRSHYALPSEPAVLLDGSRGLLTAAFAAARVKASLARASSHRVIVLLRDPTSLAWVLWRELNAMPRSGAGALLRSYLQPRNFTAKVEAEISMLDTCLVAARSAGTKGWAAGGHAGAGGVHSARHAAAGGVHSGRHAAAEPATAGAGPSASAPAVSAVSVEAWQKCTAVACGWSGCVVGAGLYAPQLRAWRQAYGPSQLAVAMLSDLTTRPEPTISRLMSFVGRPAAGAHAPRALERTAADMLPRAEAAMAAARSMPRSGGRLLDEFYARFAAGVRRELELMHAPLPEWTSREGWLWADGTGRSDLDGSSSSGRRRSAAIARASPRLAAAAASPAPLLTLPRIFLLGGEKCGSTSLAFALSRHPEIRLARHALPGEPAYFRKEVCPPSSPPLAHVVSSRCSATCGR